MAFGSKATAFKVKAMAFGSKATAFKAEAMAFKTKAMAFKAEAKASEPKAAAFMAKAKAVKVKWEQNKVVDLIYILIAAELRFENGKKRYIMSNDWMPGSRTGQLAMGKKWAEYITQQKATQWSIPQQMLERLEDVVEAAGDALEIAMTSDRTAVINTRVRVKFGEMVDHMRDLRRRHFFMPPLTEMDWVALEMRLPDTVITPIGPPTTVVQAEISYPHKNALALRIVQIDGQGDDFRPDWGYRIYFGVLPQKETPEDILIERQYLRRTPDRPEELTHSHFTRRRRDLIDFEYDNSGMQCFICVRYENGKGDKGPWGPMVQTFIP